MTEQRFKTGVAGWSRETGDNNINNNLATAVATLLRRATAAMERTLVRWVRGGAELLLGGNQQQSLTIVEEEGEEEQLVDERSRSVA